MTQRSVVVRLRAEIAEFKRAFNEATKAVDDTTKATERVGKSSKKSGEDAQTGAKQAQAASARLVKSAQDQEQAWTTAGTAITAFGAAATLAFAGAVKAAIDWESAWTGVTKTVNFTSGRQMREIEQGLRDLTKILPASHQEIAAVAEAAGQLGVQTSGIVDFTKVMLELGETTNLTADEAATSLAQLMNVMGTAPKDVERLGATLVALGNAGASTEKDILSMATRISGAGKLIGASEGEVLALSSALADLGITSELGSGVATRVLLKLYAAVQGGGVILDKFAAVAGQSADEFAASFRDAPIQTLDAFTQGLNRVEASGGNVIQTLGALGFESTEDLRVILQLKGAGDRLADSLDRQADAWAKATALSAEADKRNAKTAAQLEIAMNQIRDAAIDAGAVFLPMVADIAGATADLAGAFADLPAPLQGAVAGLTGIAGVAALAAGAFLLLFPRVIATVEGFRTLQTISPRAASALGKTTIVVGKLTASLAAATAAIALLDKGLDARDTVTQYTKALEDLNAAVQHGSGSVLEDLGVAFDRLVTPSAMERFNNFSSELNKLAGGQSTPEVLRARFELLGESIATLYDSDPELAAERFNEVLKVTGATQEQLLDLFPAYRDRLDEATSAQQAAADSGNSAAAALAGTATSVEEVSKAVQEWRDAVSDADAGFIDLMAAYQAVIDKNTEVAQSTADATKSSEDSWEDYYDGVSVKFTDFLKQLEEQVEAQTNWESNIKALIGRVSDETIDYLIQLGPQAAPLIADMVKASDSELAKMEKLFAQRGKNATDAFIAEVEGARAKPEIDVYANTDPGRAGVMAFQNWAQSQATTITFTANIRKGTGWYDVRNHGVNPVREATGGAISGPGTGTSDSIPALLSNGEHVWTAREVLAAGGQAAMYRMRASVLSGRRFASGGAVERDRERSKEARERQQRIAELIREYRMELRRGGISDSITGGLSGAYSTIDRVLDLSRNTDLSKGSRRDLARAARDAEPALRRLYDRAEGIEKKLAAAKDRLDDLKQTRDQVSSGLQGGFSFESTVKSATTQFDRPDGTIGTRVDVVKVRSNAQAYAGKVKTLAGKLDQLRKLGMPASLLVQIAALPVDDALSAADAWIAAGKGEVTGVAKAFADIEKYSNLAGTNVTKAMYQGGVDAAQGLVDGLESQQKAIEKQIAKIAQSLIRTLKRELGIHSPSRESIDIADNFAGTLVGRLGSWEGRVTTAAGALVAGMSQNASWTVPGGAQGPVEYHEHYHLDSAAAASTATGYALETQKVKARQLTVLQR